MFDLSPWWGVFDNEDGWVCRGANRLEFTLGTFYVVLLIQLMVHCSSG